VTGTALGAGDSPRGSTGGAGGGSESGDPVGHPPRTGDRPSGPSLVVGGPAVVGTVGAQAPPVRQGVGGPRDPSPGRETEDSDFSPAPYEPGPRRSGPRYRADTAGSPEWGTLRIPDVRVGGAAIRAAARDSLDELFGSIRDLLSLVESALRATQRSRRHHRARSSSSSAEDYSGGGGWRRRRRLLARNSDRDFGAPRPRAIPARVVPADDRYTSILDCTTYALANTDTRYNRAMAHGLGRLRKNVSATSCRDTEWDGTPPLGVFEFLNRFFKASKDNDVPEDRSFYLLPEFTKGDLKRNSCTIMPSLQGGRSGEVSF